MQTIHEDSPNTFEGSFTKDLIFSKFWMCQELLGCMKNTSTEMFGSCVILGSWYGNMGLILSLYPIQIKKLILIDLDEKCINISRLMTKHLPFEVESRVQDAKDVEYGDNKPLIINTSSNDMQHHEWYPRIPSGAMVAIQSRNDHETLSQMDQRYPMSNTMFLKSRLLKDPEMSYHRLMKIGLK